VSEPIALKVTRWQCPHCHRSRASKKATTEHIGRCWNNPAVRACRTCVNYRVVPTGDWCFPGRPCNCNDGYIECLAGIDTVADGSIVTGCEKWAAAA
jgi:hypothetical protein